MEKTLFEWVGLATAADSMVAEITVEPVPPEILKMISGRRKKNAVRLVVAAKLVYFVSSLICSTRVRAI